LGKALTNDEPKGIAKFKNLPPIENRIPLPKNKIGSLEELKSYLEEVKKPLATEPITPTDANTGVLFEPPQVGFKLAKKEAVVELSDDYFYLISLDWAFLDEVKKVQKNRFAGEYRSWEDVLSIYTKFPEFETSVDKFNQDEHKQYIVDAPILETILKRLYSLNSDIYHKNEVGYRYAIGIPYRKKKDGTINVFTYFKYPKYPQATTLFLPNSQKEVQMILDDIHKKYCVVDGQIKWSNPIDLG